MRHFLILIFHILFTCRAIAYPLCHIQHYDESDGLTQWHITQMTQDKQGFMWFSTWNGLCRFDGYEFQGFKCHVGDGGKISTDRFRNVWLNDDGNIGCRVDDDLYIFNLKTYKFETRKYIKQNNKHARNIKPDRPYRFLCKDGITWTIYHNGILTFKTVNGIETPYCTAEKMEAPKMCMPDKQGNLWVVGTNGLYKICFLKQHGTINRNTQSAETKVFFTDKHNRYWIATKEDNAIRIFDKNNNLIGYLSESGKITKNYAKLQNPVYCITQINDGTIWIGSKPGGLFQLKEHHGGIEYEIKKIKNLRYTNVYDIKEDRWGRLWIATLGGGIFCIPNPSSSSPKVLSPHKELKLYPQKLAQKARMIFITKKNIMLVATTDGLVTTKLLPGRDVEKMVYRCHKREPEREDALSCSATMNIAEDSKGRIYVSTESGGVNMIKSDDLTAPQLSFLHFDKTNGLSTDIALSVVSIGEQLLIVGSNSIILLNPNNRSSISFGKNYLLSECRFSEAIPHILPNGEWIFGLQDGTFRIKMSQLYKSSFVPNIAFTGINIQGKSSTLPINALKTLILPKNERSFTIKFAALDYSADADIRYKFSMTEADDGTTIKWNDVGHDHSATLLDLKPGKYTLRIISTNGDGVWCNNERKLTVIVTPTFAETTTAHVLFIIIICICLGAVIYTYIYIRRIRKQRHEALEAYLSLLNTGNPKEDLQKKHLIQSRLSDEDDNLMRRISTFVEENIGNSEIGVGDMADAVAMSRSGLQRKIKQIMGVTPLDFLKEARIKHACNLLSTTNMPISEIAFACGYSDPKYFSRSFKTSTGKSPKGWREQTNVP